MLKIPMSNRMFYLVANIIWSSINNLFKNQPDILSDTSITNMTEWNFAHHLANEIAKYIFWLNHDIDVVKRNMNNHRPDIIFHKRGYNNMNFLVIEIKIGRNLSRDIKRIKEDWMSNPLKYRFGASIKIDRSNEEDWEFTLFDRDGNANLFKSNSIFSPPIPKIPESAQQPFITLVDQILSITNTPTPLYERGNNPSADADTPLQEGNDSPSVKGWQPKVDGVVEEGGNTPAPL